MRIERDVIVFSSGRTLPRSAGNIGIDAANWDDMELTEGYDDSLWRPDTQWLEPEIALKREDLIELADYMISRWHAFRAKVMA